MKRDFRTGIVFALSSIASGVILACGGQTNDQGVSVSFLGVYGEISTSQSITATPTPSTNNNNNNIFNTIGCAQVPQVGRSGTIVIGNQSGVDGILGIQNNLYGQFFRADQLVLDFFIAGASIQPPSYTAGVSILAGPAEAASNSTVNNNTNTTNQNNQNTVNNPNNVTNGTNVDNVHGRVRYPQHTSLPPSWNNVCNTQFRRLPLVPIETGAWMLFNRDHLPPLPFTIEITARFIGTSSAGNVYETNTVYHAIQVYGGGSADADSASGEAEPSSLSDPSSEGDESDVPMQDDDSSDEGPAVLLEDMDSKDSSSIEY